MALGSVPIIDSAQLETSTGRRQAQASPEAAGAGVARGLAQVSAGLDNAAQAVTQINARLDEANVNDLDAQYTEFQRQQFYDPQNGYFAKQGKNAMEDRLPLEQRINDQIGVIAQSARSPKAQAAFLDLARRRAGDAMTRADNYAQDQFKVYEDQTFLARAKEAGEDLISGFNDPIGRARSEATIRSIWNDIGQRKGASDETKAVMINDAVSGAYTDAIALQIQNNPYEAKKQLEAKEGWGSKVGAEAKARLLIAADNEIERRAAKWRASVRDQVSAQIDLMDAGVPVSHPMDVATVRSALGEAAAQQFEFHRNAAQERATMELAPSTTLLEALAAPAVKPKSEADVPAMLLDSARKKAANDILKSRVDDPMAYQINQGLLPPDATGGLEALDKGKSDGKFDAFAEIVKKRIASVQENSQRYGLSPEPLTKMEAAELSEMLGVMDAKTRASTLGLISQAAGDATSPSNVAMMGQIAGEGAPVIGYAGWLMGQKDTRTVAGYTGQKAARVILEGQSLLAPTKADKDAGIDKIKMPSDDKLRVEWAEYTGDAYVLRPTEAGDDFGAFKAVYAALAAESGAQDGLLDPKITPKAAAIASGGVGAVFGDKTVLPWGMSASGLQQSIRDGWPKISKTYGLDPAPDNYRFIPYGPNRYQVISGNAPVYDAQGRLAVITVKP